MQCPQCQHENRESAKFCEECGAGFLQACPYCGHEVRPQAKFCDECGRSLAAPTAVNGPTEPATPIAAPQEAEPLPLTPQHLAEKILTSRAALEGERKQVTVLFADIKDSTELIKDLDPEAAQQLLDPAIHLMMDAVHRFEGTVNQVLGDGIMALFGAPIAHEDHAARGCYVALAMQAAMRDYAETVLRAQGIPLQIRVGLNAGEVVVRTIGNDLHMDYSAVGPTTHLAARMEQLATPGSIRLSAATLRLVEGLVQVNALGRVPVKGMTEPVEVFELTGASTIRRRLQAAVARGLTRFVGRDTEMQALHRALQQAAAGHGQIVAVVGEAGMGKSRLAYEFVHSHRTQGWLVLESASMSYGKATPYFPVLDLLKRYVHVEDDDAPRTVRAKVTGHILTLDESLHETLPALLSLLDALPADSPFVQLDPPQRRQRTLDSLKRILLRESQVQPLLLVFEDLHWIDSETQALLDSVIEGLPTARLLLLVNYRPEYQHSWGSKTFYTQLRLDALPPASADAFLDALLGDDPNLKPLKTLLIERTQGNPFFLEESVRTLVETQVLVGAPGAYRLQQDLPAIQVPATVQAILAARMDRLPADEKQLLQTAAVIGNEMPLSLLRTIMTLSDETLHRGLTQLQTAESLYETSLFPDHVYTFKHALTHEVAYGSLLQERRRVLHAQIVEALETLGDERLGEQVERLAHHAFRGELWDKAIMYYRRSGAAAMAQSAHHEAVVFFEQALQALQHLPESREMDAYDLALRFDLRNALLPLGAHERALYHLREAETIATHLDDHHRLGRVSSYLATQFLHMARYNQAIAAGQHALALATAPENFDVKILAQGYLGVTCLHVGDYRQALVYADQILASLDDESAYEFFGNVQPPVLLARLVLTYGHAETGGFAEGIPHGEDAIRIAEELAQSYILASMYLRLAMLYYRKGDLEQALQLLERSYPLCQEANLQLLPMTSSFLGATYALSGRRSEAQALLDQSAAHLASETSKFGLPVRLTVLSEALLCMNRIEEAHRLAGRLFDLVRTYPDSGYQAHARRLFAEVAAHRDPPQIEPAETHYQQALTLADAFGMRPLQAHCHRGLGTLYSRTGCLEQAHAELSAAVEMYRNMEMMFWLPETEVALAEVERL